MLNSKGLRKLQNKLSLKKLASRGAYQVKLDPNTGIAVLVDNDGNFIYFPKPTDTNSPEWALYLFLRNYNNRLNNPYGTNEEGGVPIVFGADILGSQLLRKYVRPGNPLGGGISDNQNDTYSQLIYRSNPDNPINLINVIKNLAFADAEFRGMHFGSNISPYRLPTSSDFSDIFKAHETGEVSYSGLLTHLNLSIVDPETINTRTVVTTTNPLHNWYASEIEDDLRHRGYPELLILARPTSNVATVAGRAAESPFDSSVGGWRLTGHALWSSVFGDTEFMKTMREIEARAAFMENENRFIRFVPMHQQAAYRTLRELERQGQLKDPFFVNGNMFYIAPTTVTEDGEDILVWSPGSTFIDLVNRKDLELINIENALTNEAALTEAINAINATMYEGSPQPKLSPEAQLLFRVLDNNRREFYLLDTPKILEDGRKLLYDVDKMPSAYTSILTYYSEPKNYNRNNLGSQSSVNPLDSPINNPLHYRTPSLSDFALFLNENVRNNTNRVFIDSEGRRFVTRNSLNNLPLYRHVSENLNPTTDIEAYEAINRANYGWLNRDYGLHYTYGNPYALLITGGILESAYLRKRDSDKLLEILGSLGDSSINHGIEITGNRSSTGPTPYLHHYYSYMGFDPSTMRVPADGKLFGIRVFDNPGGVYSTDTVMNSDRFRHMRTSDFSHDWELWAHGAGKWVQQQAMELGGSKSDGEVLGELAQLGAGIFNPQMWIPGLMDTSIAWTDGTGWWQNKIDLNKFGNLYGTDITRFNAAQIFNSDAFGEYGSAYYNPYSVLAGTPQTILSDLSAVPLLTMGGKGLGALYRGARRLTGRGTNIPGIQEFVATGPVIKGNRSFVLNEASSAGDLTVSRSGANLVYNGNKPIALGDLLTNNALVRNSRGQYIRAIDLENAKSNGVDISPFWKPGEKLTLLASPDEIATASNGILSTGLRGTVATVADLYLTGGTAPNAVFNWLRPILATRGMRYDAARRASMGSWFRYKPFSWEQLFGKSGARRSNTFGYNEKTKTLTTDNPVEGLIGVHGGGRWNPLNWYLSLVYDSEGHIRPIVSPIVGRRSLSRLASYITPHVQVNRDPHFLQNNTQVPGELINTANYYTQSTYNTPIDEYVNNDYINKNKLLREGLTASTAMWPWLAIGGAGLGLGILLSNRKKEKEEKKKKKRQQYLLHLLLSQEYDPPNMNYMREYYNK